MVPIIINPIYALYSGYIISGILYTLLKGLLLRGLNVKQLGQLGTIPRVQYDHHIFSRNELRELKVLAD